MTNGQLCIHAYKAFHFYELLFKAQEVFFSSCIWTPPVAAPAVSAAGGCAAALLGEEAGVRSRAAAAAREVTSRLMDGSCASVAAVKSAGQAKGRQGWAARTSLPNQPCRHPPLSSECLAQRSFVLACAAPGLPPPTRALHVRQARLQVQPACGLSVQRRQEDPGGEGKGAHPEVALRPPALAEVADLLRRRHASKGPRGL